MISKIYSLPISNSIILLYHPYVLTRSFPCIDRIPFIYIRVSSIFLNIATGTGRKKEEEERVPQDLNTLSRFQFAIYRQRRFPENRKIVGRGWPNEEVDTRLEETWTWDEREMTCGSESETIVDHSSRWKKSLAFETFSSLQEDHPIVDEATITDPILFRFGMEHTRVLLIFIMMIRIARRIFLIFNEFEDYWNCFKISLVYRRNFNFVRS